MRAVQAIARAKIPVSSEAAAHRPGAHMRRIEASRRKARAIAEKVWMGALSILTLYFRRGFGGLALVLFGMAAWCCVRSGYADWLYRRNAMDDVVRAVRLAPGNATYAAWLAQL